MIRLLKRYESRKLYDTEISRYVSLEEVASFVRDGQEVQVIDNASGDDVTSQVLAQVILDEGRRGRGGLSVDFLHELVRKGEEALTSGVGQAKAGVERLVERSFDRLAPVREAREEMTVLRSRLEQLEQSLSGLERSEIVAAAANRATATETAKKKTAKKKAAKKTTAKKKATKKTAKKTASKKKVAKKTASKKTASKKTASKKKTTSKATAKKSASAKK